MAKIFPNVALLLVLQLVVYGQITAATWCVARNDAKEDALQQALDYACSAGADCTPLQDTGLCFLPNTIQAHASYAFNSFYMHAAMGTGSCDFSGTATIAKTDPSYGTCVYPSSPRFFLDEQMPSFSAPTWASICKAKSYGSTPFYL